MDEAQERALPGQPTMTIAELISKVSDEVWAGAEKSDGRQRALQADHVEVLARLYLQPQSYPRDAHTLARLQLGKIAQISAQALARGVDETALAHLQAVAGRINALANERACFRPPHGPVPQRRHRVASSSRADRGP